MPPTASPHRSPLRLSAGTVLPLFLALASLIVLGWTVHAGRMERQALQEELTALRLAHRAAASRESQAADAVRRARRLEEALAVMRRDPVVAESPDAARAVELERVVAFLREEIKAAHETIDRLKQEQR